MRYIMGWLVVFFVVSVYFVVRKWVDRSKEKIQDNEIVREHEEYLGSWAYKSSESLIQFRLKRDGMFTYNVTNYHKKDSINITGKYEIAGMVDGRSAMYYPRLIAISDHNDTVFNHFITYITPYDAYASAKGFDKMVLSKSGIYDTITHRFYRVK